MDAMLSRIQPLRSGQIGYWPCLNVTRGVHEAARKLTYGSKLFEDDRGRMYMGHSWMPMSLQGKGSHLGGEKQEAWGRGGGGNIEAVIFKSQSSSGGRKREAFTTLGRG